MIRSALLLLLLAAPALASNPIAEVLCEPTSRMTEKLTRQMHSQRQNVGLRGPEQVLEVWTDKRGDWTMVITYASGQSCIVAMGEAWLDTKAKDPA
ncbi:hypothetical protein [Pseudooceanicola sp.]|uniref:hypothetical protein n=1 Tax=Pseudooceanicola sp. TaxID=1914328 RepID=UPI0035C749A6